MSKNKGTSMKPWQTPAQDNWANSFLMVDVDMFESQVFQKLTATTRLIYIWLIGYCCGQREFNCSYSQADKAGFKESTFHEGLKKLQEAGFIKVVSGKRKMEVNTIKFTDDWKRTLPTEPTKGKPRGKPFQKKNPTANFADAP